MSEIEKAYSGGLATNVERPIADPGIEPHRLRMTDKDEGAAFSKATGITGMVDADDAVLKELDPYLMPTRRVMGMAN